MQVPVTATGCTGVQFVPSILDSHFNMGRFAFWKWRLLSWL